MTAIAARAGAATLHAGRRVIVGFLAGTRKHPLITIALAMWFISGVGVMVAWADPEGPTKPAGMGQLVPMPDLTNGGTPSLFESSGYLTWTTDSDFKRVDIWQPIVQLLANMIWMLAVFLVYAAIGLVWWLLSMASFTQITDVLAAAIGASATELLQWLLPSALVIGLLWAWIQHSRQVFSAAAWVVVAAVLGGSLAWYSQTWVDGVNNIRTVGADAVTSMTANAVSPNQQYPFPWPATSYGAGGGEPTCNPKTGDCEVPDEPSGEERQTIMLRKTGDAMWRGLVATPWCIIEFGSMEACERYGADMVKKGSNLDARTNYIKKDITNAEGGPDAPTVKWVKGYNAGERISLALLSLVVNLVFCGVVVVLGFSAVSALILTFFYLFLGVPFALTWCIEGRPRQIGMRWLEGLIGAIMQGLIATAVFGSMLVLLTVQFSLIGSWGWLPTIGIALVICVTALTFRRHVMGFFGIIAGGPSGASRLGAMVLRQLSRITSRTRTQSAQPHRAGMPAPPNARPRQDQTPSPHPRRRPAIVGAPTGRAIERPAPARRALPPGPGGNPSPAPDSNGHGPQQPGGPRAATRQAGDRSRTASSRPQPSRRHTADFRAARSGTGGLSSTGTTGDRWRVNGTNHASQATGQAGGPSTTRSEQSSTESESVERRTTGQRSTETSRSQPTARNDSTRQDSTRQRDQSASPQGERRAPNGSAAQPNKARQRQQSAAGQPPVRSQSPEARQQTRRAPRSTNQTARPAAVSRRSTLAEETRPAASPRQRRTTTTTNAARTTETTRTSRRSTETARTTVRRSATKPNGGGRRA